ncbi:MAG: hypothetical protein P8Y23_17135, partial [Candidatus Lokiarchaeota archaeon]
IIDGLILYASVKYIKGNKLGKKSSQILGLLSISVGIINLIAFIILLVINPGQPILLTGFWVLISVILIIFGIKLITKKLKKL